MGLPWPTGNGRANKGNKRPVRRGSASATEKQSYRDQSSEAASAPSACEYPRRGDRKLLGDALLTCTALAHPTLRFSPILLHTIGNHNSTQHSRVGMDNEDKRDYEVTAPWNWAVAEIGRGEIWINNPTSLLGQESLSPGAANGIRWPVLLAHSQTCTGRDHFSFPDGRVTRPRATQQRPHSSGAWRRVDF